LGKHSKSKHLKKNVNKKKMVINVMQLIFIIIIIYSLFKIVQWHNNNKQSEKIMREISNSIIVEKNKDDKSVEDNYKINFKALKEANNDTVGFLKVKGTEIEYPVVKGNNNDFYLNHSFDKSSNAAGWIFVDYRNKLDGTDKNVIIYGHNRRDGSMFYTLKSILNKDWYEKKENLKVNFITEAENAVYEVFSVYEIEAENYYTKTNFNTSDEYTKFLETIKKRSKKDFDINLTSEDKILTLSTCANNNKYRVVLHAKKIIY